MFNRLLASATVLFCLSPLASAAETSAVVSFSVLADIVHQVGGDKVKVKTLVGPDGDPHTYEPAPADSVAINKADVVFVSGLGLEGWIPRLVKASGYQGKVITASEGIKSRTMSEDGETVTDPHAWNSAANGEIYARNVMNALIAADPEDADYFRKNGEAYIKQLAELDDWAQKKLAAVPEEKRKVLTSHDAFGYFGDRYGVKFLAPVGFSTEAQASAQQVGELINQIKKEGISTYFIENQTDPRLVKQIAQATGAESGGELYPEALTAAGGDAPTYVAAFRHNVKSILKSLK